MTTNPKPCDHCEWKGCRHCLTPLLDEMRSSEPNATKPVVSGAMDDLEFCKNQITDAKSDIGRAERRIKFYESEIKRIELLIEKSAK